MSDKAGETEPNDGHTRLQPTRQSRKGWVRVLLAGLALFSALAAIVWWGYLPQWRPELGASERYGVDVSSHQGEIDWDAVSSDDVEFAYIKATEGGDFIDDWFDRNWVDAQNAGLEVGAYHFFTLCRPGAEQAQNYLNVVPLAEADLAPALDLEFPGNCSKRPPIEQVQQDVAAWIEKVEEAAGRDVLLYVEKPFDDQYHITSMFEQRTWHRKILRRPDGDRWDVWQFSFFADVDGIDGGVDLNIMRPAES